MISRILDLLASIVGLVLLAVPFAVIALLVRLDSPGPAFFRQERSGLGGRRFRVWKFRTMVDNAASMGLGNTVAQDDARITRVGRHLRNWGLDELPQLINVFQGQMALVGPRPTLVTQTELYSPTQRRRLDVKPGVTGWALVNGRNALTWPERIELDLWYVEHRSLWLDIRILFRTLWVVLVVREGIYGPDGVNDDFVADESAASNEEGAIRGGSQRVANAVKPHAGTG